MPRFRDGVPGVTVPLVWIDIQAVERVAINQYLQQWEDKVAPPPATVKSLVEQTLTWAKSNGYDLTQCTAQLIAAELKEIGSAHLFATASLRELEEYSQQWKMNQLCRK